jgi:hypothetical protein
VSKPILHDYFRDTANVLLAQYNRTKGQESSDNVGFNRELLCGQFLSRVLPRRVLLERGEIMDSSGNRTGQLEIVMTRDDCPALEFGAQQGAKTFLVEGVLGVIEVKSNLSGDKLQEGIAQLQLVRDLELRRSGYGGSGPFVTLGRPLRCIFAYEGATKRTLLAKLNDPANTGTADIVCVLKRGVFVSRKVLLRWEPDQQYIWLDGATAALAWFYLYLVSYAASFMSQGLYLANYFWPFEAWTGS